MIEVVVLGSGAASPQVGRANACYLVRTDLPMLFDLGPGALVNMLHGGIDRSRIAHIFWTHLHADHISDFIPFFFHEMCASKQRPREDLALYGPPGTKKLVGAVRRVFPGFDQSRFGFRVREVRTGQIRLGQTLVTAHPVRHSPRLHAVGYRIQYAGRTVVYSGDASFCPELVELCRDADLAIIEATTPAEHPVKGHLTAPEACEAARVAGVRKLVLTHFDPIWKGYDLKTQCAGRFEGELIAAEDLMRIQV